MNLGTKRGIEKLDFSRVVVAIDKFADAKRFGFWFKKVEPISLKVPHDQPKFGRARLHLHCRLAPFAHRTSGSRHFMSSAERTSTFEHEGQVSEKFFESEANVDDHPSVPSSRRPGKSRLEFHNRKDD